jgi:hypothetical protein
MVYAEPAMVGAEPDMVGVLLVLFGRSSKKKNQAEPTKQGQN